MVTFVLVCLCLLCLCLIDNISSKIVSLLPVVLFVLPINVHV